MGVAATLPELSEWTLLWSLFLSGIDVHWTIDITQLNKN